VRGEDGEVASAATADRPAVELRVLMNDVATEGDVDGDGNAEPPTGCQEAPVLVRVAAVAITRPRVSP